MTDADLRELADAYGVATEYWGSAGHVDVGAETLCAVLTALGADLSAGCRAALDHRRDDAWRRPLPPCTVVRGGESSVVAVHVPAGTPAVVRLRLEDGDTLPLFQVDDWEPDREVDGQLVGEASFAVPAGIPPGYHTLELTNGDVRHRAPLIACPRFLGLPASVGRGRIWGYAVQLYSVTSGDSWGIGDLQDLADLAIWSATSHGADYLLTNPLHAAEPTPPIGPSPYSPSSRRFVHPIYVRPEAVPEYATLTNAARDLVRARRDQLRADLANRDLIDRDAIWTAKIAALRAIYDAGLNPMRRVSYAGYVARHRQALRDFAIWCAITELHGHDWRGWPTDLRDPRSDAVAAYAEQHEDRVEFHCWLQWVAGDQLVAAHARATDAGMRVGIVNDIAVGVGPGSSEVWARPDVFAQGVSVGAPPDAYNRLGQDWSQSPWRPDRLADSG